MGDQGWKGKWWAVIKAVAYEIRPFTLPKKDDLKVAMTSLKTNVEQISAEAKRLTPEVCNTVKEMSPFTILAVFAWLYGWAGSIWFEFGTVYFIVSAFVMIFVNLGEKQDGEWSAYSVFNAGCRALLGTINVEQFEREIMRQNLVDLDDDLDLEDEDGNADDEDQGERLEEEDTELEEEAKDGGNEEEEGQEEEEEGQGAGGNGAMEPLAQEPEYVWVEPPAARVPGDIGAGAGGAGEGFDGNEEHLRAQGGLGAAGDGARFEGRDGGRRDRGGRRVSGKRARRGFEERRERQEERRLALEALGPQEHWDDF